MAIRTAVTVLWQATAIRSNIWVPFLVTGRGVPANVIFSSIVLSVDLPLPWQVWHCKQWTCLRLLKVHKMLYKIWIAHLFLSAILGTNKEWTRLGVNVCEHTATGGATELHDDFLIMYHREGYTCGTIFWECQAPKEGDTVFTWTIGPTLLTRAYAL